MYTDPIADMLSRVRNAQAVNKESVDIPYSEFKYAVAKCIEKEGFVEKVAKKKKDGKNYLSITLKYEKGKSVISEITRVSSPGQRTYAKGKDIKGVKGGRGVAIISTPKGVLTNRQARKMGVGGEVVCEVW